MTTLEIAARALANAQGFDPDSQSHVQSPGDLAALQRGDVVRPAWRDFEPEASRMIAVLEALKVIPSHPG